MSQQVMKPREVPLGGLRAIMEIPETVALDPSVD